MEYVDGEDIEESLRKAPERSSELFLQALEGFRHLETNSILHRDIRPQNVMVRNDGILKIIDLGFGKQMKEPNDRDKSISLNWWCEPPEEFDDRVYDSRTEVYFVGKLFEKLIQDYDIGHFKYSSILGRMCHRSPESRIASFLDAQKEIRNDRFEDIAYTFDELRCYRAFSEAMMNQLAKIENGTKYIDDLERIEAHLGDAYKRVMLEETVPDARLVLDCFLNGSYSFYKGGFPVVAVKGFLGILGSCTYEKQRIVLANLHTKLDSVPRYSTTDVEDEIPF